MTQANPKSISKRRTFDENFKREAVRQFESTSKNTTEFPSELGIAYSVFSRWRKQFGVAARRLERKAKGLLPLKHDEQEVVALKRQLKEVQNELDIIKKSHAFFARDRI